jgi:hypothetical protein
LVQIVLHDLIGPSPQVVEIIEIASAGAEFGRIAKRNSRSAQGLPARLRPFSVHLDRDDAVDIERRAGGDDHGRI